MFLSAAEREGVAGHDVLRVALGIVAVTIFVLIIFSEAILALFDFVVAGVVRGVEDFFHSGAKGGI